MEQEEGLRARDLLMGGGRKGGRTDWEIRKEMDGGCDWFDECRESLESWCFPFLEQARLLVSSPDRRG